MELVTRGTKAIHMLPRHKLQKNFNLDEVSQEEKIEKAEDTIYRLTQARAQVIDKLQMMEFERDDLKIRLYNRIYEYGIYNICNSEMNLQFWLQALGEHHRAERDRKEHLHKVNNLFHQLRQGRNTSVEEKRIQRAIESCAHERNHISTADDTDNKGQPHARAYSTNIGFEERSGHRLNPLVQWNRIKTIKWIEEKIQALYDELEELRKQKKGYDSKEKQLKKRLGAAEKEIVALRRKLEDINCRREEVYTYMLHLKK